MLADTLPRSLDEAAAAHPDLAVTFPDEQTQLTVAELASSSAAMAAGLVGRTFGAGGAGGAIGVLCQNAPEFLQALFAANRAGAAACPFPLPAGMRGIEAYLDRLRRIVAVAEIRHVIVSPRSRRLVDALISHLPDVEFLEVAEIVRAPRPAVLPDVEPTDTAVIQFTSGATGAPKGVMLSHRNIMACLEAISRGIELDHSDRGGCWLPLFHDMGLFATLTGILHGVPVTVWSPASFVKNPAGWLREFLAAGCTVSAAPNFAYDYLADAVPAEDIARLSMRHWRIAFNGGETIPAESVEDFCDRFAPAGFRPETMFPVYGMAEATLAATFPPLGRAPVFEWVDREGLADGRARPVARETPGARGLVAVGRAVRGMRVRAGDPGTGAELPDGCVGELQLRGLSVMTGYLQSPGASAQPFTEDGWLRTGDLGFLRDGELFVTGRIKEMIAVRGANFYPEDVESLVRGTPGIYKRRCVAFADTTSSGAERIIVVAETRLRDEAAGAALTTDIRKQVAQGLGLTELGVQLVAPGTIPRTTSGKFQRTATRELVEAPEERTHEPVR